MMPEDERALQEIISELQENIELGEAIVDICQSWDRDDQTYIRANKAGLELLALELLNAAGRFPKQIEHAQPQHIFFNNPELLTGGDPKIHHIEAADTPLPVPTGDWTKATWPDRAFEWGCLLTVVLMLASMIVGLITIGRWLIL